MIGERIYYFTFSSFALMLFPLAPELGLFSPDASLLKAGPRDQPYKRVVYSPLVDVINGDIDRGMTRLKKRHKTYPDDPEFHYAFALAYGQKGRMERAMEHVEKALANGLPIERFQAGPRYLMAPFLNRDDYQTLLKKHGKQLLHGPMVGSVTDGRARFWVRTYEEVPVKVRVRPVERPDSAMESRTVHTRRNRDYTAVAEIQGLSPATAYRYSLVVDGKQKENKNWTFRTFPPENTPASFKIGFAGCAGYTPWNERIWRTIAKHDFPAFLLSGDRHRADVWKISRPEAYDLYEFENAKLTNIHTHREFPEKALFSYNDKNMFGSLEIDTTKPNPSVTYKIITIDNEVVHSFTIRKAELSY